MKLKFISKYRRFVSCNFRESHPYQSPDEVFGPRFPLVLISRLVPFPGATFSVRLHDAGSRDGLSFAMETDGKVLIALNKARHEDDFLDADEQVLTVSSFEDTALLASIVSVKEKDGDLIAEFEVLVRAQISALHLKPFHLFKDESSIRLKQSYPNLILADLRFVRTVSVQDDDLLEAQALRRQIIQYVDSLVRREGIQALERFAQKISEIDDLKEFVDYVSEHYHMPYPKKILLLNERRLLERLRFAAIIMVEEQNLLEIQKDLMTKVKAAIDRNQKEYFLREQLKVIRDELGESESAEVEEEKYLAKLKASAIPREYHEQIRKEIRKLAKTPFGSPEGGLTRNYLDLVLDLPWEKVTAENYDIAAARKQLDKDHFGLSKVKERILEFLAVRKLALEKGEPLKKAPIICLIGPPGVGKTSIAASIATAIGRKFVRMSLGGVRDEAEMRGHRKTYIGAMPGRFIQALNQANVANPVLLLDEIDKLGNDGRGDPASALLEILDPAQNKTFRDHFVEIPFDFSGAFFITTANSYQGIPLPLLDRMEVIDVSSYTNLEKLVIAKKHLLPKVLQENALQKQQVQLSKTAFERMIDTYTREAGVRRLEQLLAQVVRKAALLIAEQKKDCVHVTAQNLAQFLGKPKYQHSVIERQPAVGVVNGLAWTPVGGDILRVEVAKVKGSGKVEITGRLGEVMQESVKVALAHVRQLADSYHFDEDFNKHFDLNIHVPEGAVPKDGPSAGVTLALAILSALTERPVRHDIAMTGELTIRGHVLPIGGLKEKLIAAHQGGVKEVFIPSQNQKDLEDLPEEIRQTLQIHTVARSREVFQRALLELPAVNGMR